MSTMTYEPLPGAALRVLSLGAGVQSTTLALLAAEGVLPRLDAAIFADTGWEPAAVYEQLARIESTLTAAGVQCYRVSRGNIKDDHLAPTTTFLSMPLFTKAAQRVGSTMGRRQCTHQYKLRPVRQKTRELLGYPPPQRVPRRFFAETWVGFSTDELFRVNPGNSPQYARLTHPLVDLGMSRKDCERFLRERGWSTAKSACIGCPFAGNRQWRELRDERPDEWADAVAFDAALRSAHPDMQPSYLHSSLLPLSEAPIDRVTRREWNDRQVDLLDLVEEGDPDGCSPYGCRSGNPVP